jgi:tripartite ATP-independent transporter DctM subunit
MTALEVGAAAIVALLVLIAIGMPIGIGMLAVSLVAVGEIRNQQVALRMIGQVANDSVREHLFAVVPLFVLMGLLVTISGVGRDTFDLFERLLWRVRAGLGIATVFANAVFASITGISIASASVFARVAVPEMLRHGYTRRFATGVVAGSSVLGMLIPPSLLMIIYAVLAEESVGRMFFAGIVPGLLLAATYAAMIYAMARLRPGMVFEAGRSDRAEVAGGQEGADRGLHVVRRGLPIVSLVGLVLGGIYTGWFTPTEAGAVGAFGALVIALLRRSMDLPSFWRVLIETGQITVSVLFLIMAASFFARMLTLSGLPHALAAFLLEGLLGPYGFLAVYIVLIVLMGTLIDSVSIMLIVLPVALTVAKAAGFDMIWFGVLTVVAVEVGLLTPPFGLSVFTIKAALEDKTISAGDIFRGATPFVLAMLFVIAILAAFPPLSTTLARW